MLNPPNQYVLKKSEIRRPKYAKDKTLHIGMKLYRADDGVIEARLRAPKGGGRAIGVVLRSQEEYVAVMFEYTTLILD